MTIHEYACPRCGNVMEKFFMPRETQWRTMRCDNENCDRKKRAMRITSGGAFHLYGDGWTGGREENKSWEERKTRRRQRLPRASDEDIAEVRANLSGRAPAVEDGYTEHNE